jgi:hypothetical protein
MELRQIIEKFEIKSKLLINEFIFIIKVYLCKPKLIFIGDSHSYFIGSGQVNPVMYKFISKEEAIIHLGPKTIYTIAQKGIKLNKILKFCLRRIYKLKIVISFGEIDVRYRLYNKEYLENFIFVLQDYKKQIDIFAFDVNVTCIVLLTPVPPTDKGFENPNYPKNGVLRERIEANDKVSKMLLDFFDSPYLVVDSRKILENKIREFDAELTDDGCHVNGKGSKKMKHYIYEKLENHRVT